MGFASPGRFQLLAGFLLCCIQLPVTFTDHLLHLYSATPMHRCKVRHNISLQTVGESEYRPIVEKHGKKLFSSCELYISPNDHSLGTQRCTDGWEYLHVEEEWTLVTEWNLVCEREYLINLLPYVYYAGNMIGSLIFGILGDHFGRKIHLLVALFLHTALGVSLHFLPNFSLFAIGYALQGIFVTGIQCLSFILLLETVSYAYHLKTVIILGIFWPLGILALSILAWIIRNWRYIQVAVTSPGIVCIGYFWLLPRSLPWLLTEGRLQEAENQLVRFARFNKTLLPQNFRLHLQHFSKAIRTSIGPSGSSHNLEAVVCSSKIRRFTFILYYIWFVVFFESNATSTDVPALQENKYAFLFVKGLMDLGMIILLYFLAHRFGPRFIQASLLVIGGLLCVGSAFVDYSAPLKFAPHTPALAVMSPVFAAVGKASIRAVVSTIFFFSIKIFPTGVRAIGLGSCLFWARSALLLGHHVSALEIESHRYLPIAACGILSVLGGFLTFLLPANTRRPLPNVSHEIEHDVVIDGGLRKSRVHFVKPTSISTLPPRHHHHHHHHHHLFSLPANETTEIDENRICDTNTLRTTNVQDIPTLRLNDATNEERNHSNSDSYRSCCCPEGVAGPSGIASDVRGDNESRLTDLEDELTKIWDLDETTIQKSFREDTRTDNSLREFHRDDLRDHFFKMHETSF